MIAGEVEEGYLRVPSHFDSQVWNTIRDLPLGWLQGEETFIFKLSWTPKTLPKALWCQSRDFHGDFKALLMSYSTPGSKDL
jgi:hypothetical protein